MKQGFLFILLLTALLIGCSGRSEEPASSAEVMMKDYTGRPVTDYFAAGTYDLVVLNYWASFCAPCKKEMVDLTALHENYRDRGVLVLGAATDGSDKKTLLEKIAGSLGVTYPILYGAEAVFNGEQIIGYPTTFIIADGRVVEKIDGARDYAFFSEMVEHHLSSLPGLSPVGGNLSDAARYSLDYDVNRGPAGNGFTVKLAPAAGYYLNGPGYPPLSVRIETPDGLSVQPTEYTLEGIALGQSEVLQFTLSGYLEQGTTLSCVLSLIACDGSTCTMIN
ncbi:MAG: TlpA family protein disulfide reductase, partial [Spirochaetales bacterium]|nr:TlpA family protein disulfide reductase [Spirochaetales bacterium]